MQSSALALTLLLVAAGCGGGMGSRKAAAIPRDDWGKLTWEERHDQMTFLVLPNMGRLFQHHDHSASPTTTCRTCHGADAETIAYRMPHGLPPLDPEHMPDTSTGTALFMQQEVLPTMSDLLGVSPSKLTCFGCHPTRAR